MVAGGLVVDADAGAFFEFSVDVFAGGDPVEEGLGVGCG